MAAPTHRPRPLFTASQLGPPQTATRRGLYAARPGTGPSRQTCGTCVHALAVRLSSKTAHKCGLCRAAWSKCEATDVRLKAAACREWEDRGGGRPRTAYAF